MSTLFAEVAADATFSPCGLYRYDLRRHVGDADHSAFTCTFIMLNPSTADAEANDPTIRRCMRFAREWGYGQLRVGNLFALRSPNPAMLKVSADPVGPDNDRFLRELVSESSLVVAAWGAHPMAAARAHTVAAMVRESKQLFFCLGMTAAGHPRHPLYVPASTALVPWKPDAVA